jgi:putative transposase
MTPRAPHPSSSEAIFRYTVVSRVQIRVHGGQKQADAVRAVAGEAHLTLGGTRRLVGKRTIYRWLAAFREDGLEGLEPKARPSSDSSDVLPNRFLGFLREQKEADPKASFPEIIRRARLVGALKPGEHVDRGTVWRAAGRMGLDTRCHRTRKDADVRRFEYANRMQMMLADGKHFRAGEGRVKRVALFFLDDASRYGLHVVVGTSENASLFLRGLYETVRRHGLMKAIFLDNGPGFIALDTIAAVAKLDANWITGTAGYAAGHGKIEKFNQTAQDDVLRYLPDNPEVDPDCGALELRLQHWLREVYNHEPHSALGKDTTPTQRWEADERPLRFPDDDADLRRRFVVHEHRTVSNDNVVSFDGVIYEIPLGHRRDRIQLHRHLLDDTIAMIHDGRLVRLAPVDPVANATSGRARPGQEPETAKPRLPPSAAELAYRRDYAPVVGLDGGFADPDTPTHED